VLDAASGDLDDQGLRCTADVARLAERGSGSPQLQGQMKPQRFVKESHKLWRYDSDECPDALDGDRSYLLGLRL